jgi:hypothetical protein
LFSFQRDIAHLFLRLWNFELSEESSDRDKLTLIKIDKLERFIFRREAFSSDLLADHSVRWDVAVRLNRKTANAQKH